MREGPGRKVRGSHAPFLPLPLLFLSPARTSLKRSSTTTFCLSFLIRRKRGSVLSRAKRGSDMAGTEEEEAAANQGARKQKLNGLPIERASG